MVYNTERTTKVSEMFTALINRIITKDVQLLSLPLEEKQTVQEN